MVDTSNHGQGPAKDQLATSPNINTSPPYHPYLPPPHGYPPYPGHGPYYDVAQNYNHSRNGGNQWIRLLIICSCFISVGFVIINLIMILRLHPQFPVFNVDSLIVSNFNTSMILSGDWNINLTAHNPNTILKGYFMDFKVDVTNENNDLAMSYVPKFELGIHEEKQILVKASSNYAVNFVSFHKWDLDKLDNERQKGFIMVSVKMSCKAKFNSSSLATRSTRMSAICEGLKVVFQKNSGTGTLDTGGNLVTCKLYK